MSFLILNCSHLKDGSHKCFAHLGHNAGSPSVGSEEEHAQLETVLNVFFAEYRSQFQTGN